MSGEIKPALTQDEWSRGTQDPALGSWVEAQCKPMSSGERLFVLRGIAFGEQRTIVGEERLPGIIALANHALPDGHPLKIAREDVRLLRAIADDYEFRGTSDNEDLNGLAAKLAALLPPEG